MHPYEAKTQELRDWLDDAMHPTTSCTKYVSVTKQGYCFLRIIRQDEHGV